MYVPYGIPSSECTCLQGPHSLFLEEQCENVLACWLDVAWQPSKKCLMTWVISNSGTVLVNMRRVMEVIMSYGVPHTQLCKT
jgi:hypothetical protein